LSFFDEDDEPRRTSRPRRDADATDAGADRQTLLIRRAVALGAALIIAILLVIAVRGCLAAQRENALEDYNREVASLGRDSARGVGTEFFNLLAQGGESPQDLQTAISNFRVQAQTHLDQAEGLSVPDEMVPAQRSLLMSLQFRRDGLAYIAGRIRTALGDQGDAADEAVAQIAGQMQSFVASDAIYQGRVRPQIRGALDEAKLGGQEIPRSQFMSNLGWLAPATVSERLGQGGGGQEGTSREVRPGTHGTGLESVTIGNQRLGPGGEPNRIPLSDELVFNVRFTNQGENDEFDVRVTLTVTGGPRPIRARATIDTIAQGSTATAPLRLPSRPTTTEPVTIQVQVAAVPGERTTDNNEAEYAAVFVTP
jgi:hypothetical protein